MDDTIKKLGSTHAQDQGRDAIHIAVLTLQATRNQVLTRGEVVNKDGLPCARNSPEAVGIIDPFLPPAAYVRKGEWFYVYLFPGTITGLAHVWSHPAFPQGEASSGPDSFLLQAAVARVAAFCAATDAYGLDYATFIEIFRRGSSRGFELEDDCIFSNDEATGEIPPEVLQDVELILGRPLTQRPSWFRCAC